MDKSYLLKDLEASLIGLPKDYQMFVGWDPNNNTDVGWLNLNQGFKLDFNHFQLREFSYRKDSEVKLEIKVIAESDIKHKNESGCKLDSKDPRDEVQADGVLEHPVVVKVRSEMRNALFSHCSHCNRLVKDLSLHEIKCKSKHSKGVDRIEYPVCKFRVLKNGLPNHLKIHNQSKKVCPHCNSFISERYFELHKERCSAALKSSQTSKCKVCEKIVAKIFFLQHIKICYLYQNQELATKSSAKTYNHEEIHLRARSKTDGEIPTAKDVNNKEEFSTPSPCDENDCVRCRLKFKMIKDGRPVKKIIKSLSFNPVGKAMKKFSIQVGKTFEELEFKSKDCVLDGKELAGSIDRGSITVRLKHSGNKGVVEGEISTDLNEIKKNWLNNNSRSPDREQVCQNEPANQDLLKTDTPDSFRFSSSEAPVCGDAVANTDNATVDELIADETQLDGANSREALGYENVQDQDFQEISFSHLESDHSVTNQVDKSDFHLFLEDSEEEMDVDKGLDGNSEVVVDFLNF